MSHHITLGLAVAFALIVGLEEHSCSSSHKAAAQTPATGTSVAQQAPTNAIPTSLQIPAPKTN